jgi:hypothetical protein
MGPVANETWGSAPTDAPPSLTGSEIDDFGCPEREVPKPVATKLIYTGTTQGHGEVVALAARLSTADGEALAQRLVTFTVAGQTLTATTDPDGLASTSATIPNHGRTQRVTVSFSGDGQHLSSATEATISWGISKIR